MIDISYTRLLYASTGANGSMCFSTGMLPSEELIVLIVKRRFARIEIKLLLVAAVAMVSPVVPVTPVWIDDIGLVLFVAFVLNVPVFEDIVLKTCL